MRHQWSQLGFDEGADHLDASAVVYDLPRCLVFEQACDLAHDLNLRRHVLSRGKEEEDQASWESVGAVEVDSVGAVSEHQDGAFEAFDASVRHRDLVPKARSDYPLAGEHGPRD